MLAKNVGPAKNSVAPNSRARAASNSGRAGSGSSTVVAPTASGNSSELPRPYAKNALAADRQRSPGLMPRTRFAYVSQTSATAPCRCIAALGEPVVPEV